MNTASKTLKIAVACVVVMAINGVPGLARGKYETIDATAYGTSTQLGRNVGVTIIIYEFSTPETRQALIEAFQKGQNQGLVNALEPRCRRLDASRFPAPSVMTFRSSG